MKRLLALLLGCAVAAQAEETGWKEIRPLLEQHCFKCHNEKKAKGNIDLSRFNSEEAILKEYKLWRRVLEQVTTQEMPPNDDTGFTQQHGNVIINGVKRTLAELEDEHPRFVDPGPAVIRRLSRFEYNNTLRDLTGLDLDVAGTIGFPQDTTGSSFDNLGAALSVPPALLEKYFNGADLVLGKLFDNAGTDGGLKSKQARFFEGLAEQPELAAVQTFLARFARHAWRRPIGEPETARLLGLYNRALAEAPPREALRKVLRGVLVAPEFLFRIEEDRTEGKSVAARVSGVELASRLSFFIWSSMPDEDLLAAAERGELAQPDALAAQVERMLTDPKAKALTEALWLRWLRADKVLEARPSTEFFPTFNYGLKRAMLDEVSTFCEHLRKENRPVLELLESDYTWVNAELAQHYGLPAVTGSEFQRVALRPEDHRGGILGMGAVLASTSHTFRTSPTQRGRWVLDVVLGTPPPPPPANAGQFKDEKQTKEPKDFREKLAQHAGDPNCAGCHRRMDPLGFGLDNFNAVGQWRATSEELNTHGELPTGERFNGSGELKQMLWSRRDEFLRNLIGQTLTFALGRPVDYFDEGQISRIKAAMEKEGFRYSSLIQSVVASYPFQYRRNAEAPAATAAN